MSSTAVVFVVDNDKSVRIAVNSLLRSRGRNLQVYSIRKRST